MNDQTYLEPNRLAENQKALRDAMPEPVFLIHDNGSIEHMNGIAEAFLATNGFTKDDELIIEQLAELLLTALGNGDLQKPGRGMFIEQHFECSTANFTGYNGDSLYWLILSPVLEPIQMNEVVLPLHSYDNGIVGNSSEIKKLLKLINQVSTNDTTVLIEGESGTGKELVANSLYKKSKRHDKPFLAINCSAISDLLLESDLFGYEKGSFTGADSRRKGKFEVVDGGTIFLDEIGDISPRMQTILLRVLQNGEIIRVGGTKPIKVNVRILAATNRDLVEAVRENKFRLDLFYRLCVIKIPVPPLRVRSGDVAELAAFFVKKYSEIYEKSIHGELSDDVILKLESYNWPGNVREMENVIQRAILMTETDYISANNISFDMAEVERKEDTADNFISNFNGASLKTIMEQVEEKVILSRLSKHRGNVANTAKALDICKAALYEKMKRHKLSAKEHR